LARQPAAARRALEQVASTSDRAHSPARVAAAVSATTGDMCCGCAPAERSTFQTPSSGIPRDTTEVDVDEEPQPYPSAICVQPVDIVVSAGDAEWWA
jgi:hypothetical protein